MNTDVSGIGVRISFYLQILFLGQWCGIKYTFQTDNFLTSLSVGTIGFTRRDCWLSVHSHRNKYGHGCRCADFRIETKSRDKFSGVCNYYLTIRRTIKATDKYTAH
jgi:hypothetical protein